MADGEKTALLQQLEKYATGETAHLVANLRGSFLGARELHEEVASTSTQALLQAAEAGIRSFLARARQREALWSPHPPGPGGAKSLRGPHDR